MSSPASPLTPSPFTDHASPVLDADPTLTDQQRSDLWDAFHSKNSEELVQHLAPLAIPSDTKKKLWEAKQQASPTGPLDKTTTAIQKMASLNPQTLELAEAHPNVLKAFTSAAMTPEKPAGEPTGTPSAAGKGTKTSVAGKPAAAPLAPRADGQPHFPPIPEGHHRVLASNSGVYDIPADRIEDARAADPNMHILNP